MLTIYNIEEDRYQMVEEPDPSLIYTYADYMQWKFKERLELFRGKIFKLGAPNTAHQNVGGKLYNGLYNYLKGKVCKVFIAPYDIRLPVKNRKKDDEITTVVQPDVCVVCDPSKVDERGVCGAPDLVIEILSPGNSEKEVRLKFELYEEAGVREYWVVNPTEENVVVFLLEGDTDARGRDADTRERNTGAREGRLPVRAAEGETWRAGEIRGPKETGGEDETGGAKQRGEMPAVGRFGGAKMYAGNDLLKSVAVTGFIIRANEIFEK